MKPIEKPQQLPKLPVPPRDCSPEQAEQLLDEWQNSVESIHQRNGQLFEKALKRMKWCSFWNGFLGQPLERHFSWCPHDDWDSYWKESGWPPLPQIEELA